LVRISTYSNDPEQFSLAAAVAQYRIAAENVTYVDGGWQTLVDGVRRAAEAHGATIVPEAHVDSITRGPEGLAVVNLSDGAQVQAESVILTAPPDAARRMLADMPAAAWAKWAPAGPPVRMSTLDVALRSLPLPKRTLALGIDEPLYFSLHSAVSRLAPQGMFFFHAAKYLPSDEQVDPARVRGEIERFLDRVQPGWSQHVVHARLLPEMTVMNSLPIPEGEKPSRATHQVPGYDNVFVAGDWVGPEGLLVDASLISAKAAAQLALAYRPRSAAPAPVTLRGAPAPVAAHAQPEAAAAG
jgi:phytoene dehydrogenase-like protein